MATDERTDAIVSAALRRYLGAAVGPDGAWPEARASRVVPGLRPEQPRSRRWPLLLAAALTMVLVAGAVLASSGLNRPSQPVLVPTGAPPAESTATPVETSSPPAAVSVDPTAVDTPTSCRSSWSITGTPPAKGASDGIEVAMLRGSTAGRLFIAFGHPLALVRGISIAPTQPPFATTTGETVKVAGNAFLKLTLSGVNKPTVDPDDIVRTPSRAPFLMRTVSAPVTEMRRIRTPEYSTVRKAPPKTGSTEVWIIGLDYSPCVRVQTIHEDGGGFGSNEPGDNTLLIDFDRPLPSESPH